LLFALFFYHPPSTPVIYTLSLHDALPICSKGEVACPAGARGDLDDTVRRIQVTVGVLRREAFVVVDVPVDDEIDLSLGGIGLDIGVIKVLPHRLHARVGGDALSSSDGRVERLVKEGQRTEPGVGGQIVLKPDLLGRTRLAVDGV